MIFSRPTRKEGKDVTIFISDLLTKETPDAAEELKAEGIDAETVLASARKTGAVVTVENRSVVAGLHSAVLETLAVDRVPAVSVGFIDRFGSVGMLSYPRKVLGMAVEDIVERAKYAVSLK